jgi:hypothetical protein
MLNVTGGSSFAPQYTATMVRHNDSQPMMLSRSFSTFDESPLSLDGLHARWQGIAPSNDTVQLDATAGRFSQTAVYALSIFVSCSGLQPCVADGDMVETVVNTRS